MIRHGIRVGHYLLWLFLAVAIPLLIFNAGTVWWMQQTQRRLQEAALIEFARDASHGVDRTFEQIQGGLRVLAGSGALQRDDYAAFGREVGLLSQHLEDLPIRLVSADGQPLVEVPEPTAVRDNVRVANSVGVTNFRFAANPLHGVVAVVEPVTGGNDGPPPRHLVAIVDRNRLARLADLPQPSPRGLIITIRDQNGVVVARSFQRDKHIGEAQRPGLMAAMAGRRFGLLPDAASLEGVPAMRAFSLARDSGYIVVAALPESSFGAEARRNLLWTVLVGLGLLVVGLSGAFLVSGRLVAALRRLNVVDATTERPSGIREVNELADRLRVTAAERDVREAELREREQRLRDLVGTLDLAAIMERELNGTIRFWSHGCARIYGWTAAEAIGKISHDLLRTRFPLPLAEIEQTLLTKGEWKGDLVHRRRDGERIVAAAHKALKRTADGEPYLLMESLVDVTALRDAQDRLRQLNQELEQRVGAEIAARQTAQQRAAHADRIQALGQLAGGIAHDFNNILQAVAGAAALIARRPGDADAITRLARIISDAAARGASITRRMLVLAHRSDLRAEPVDVAALLAGIGEVFTHTLGAAVEVRIEVPSGLPRALADRAQVETALVNLGTNARDAMPDGGRLLIAATFESVRQGGETHAADLKAGNYVRLSVSDEGTGMSATTMARIGEPFFTTKDVGRGTGLGLSMVKGFAEQSGGGFAIESQVDVGTKASIWLPCAPGEAVRAPRAPLGGEGPAVGGPSGRILLVDDDPLVRETLEAQLQHLGHKVLAASGGTDALAILRAREAVDLMITDLSMPGMNGLALIKEARGLCPMLPAILLTGYPGEASSLEPAGGPEHGSYALLRKPTTSAVLAARVAALLEH